MIIPQDKPEVEVLKEKHREKIKKINKDDQVKAEKYLSEFDKFCMEVGI